MIVGLHITSRTLLIRYIILSCDCYSVFSLFLTVKVYIHFCHILLNLEDLAGPLIYYRFSFVVDLWLLTTLSSVICT